MKFCSHCGHQLSDGSRFCPNCGKMITENPETSENSNNENKSVSPADILSESDKRQFTGNVNENTTQVRKSWKKWILPITMVLFAFSSDGFSCFLFFVLAVILSPVDIIFFLREKYIPSKKLFTVLTAFLFLFSCYISSTRNDKNPASNDLPGNSFNDFYISSPSASNYNPILESLPEVSPLLEENESAEPSADPVAESSPVAVLQPAPTSAPTPEPVDTFPQEDALKAIIVSMTNCYSYDVFTEDGNYYDPSKFHAYGEKTPAAMSLYKDGTWTRTGDNSWHVDELILKMDNNPSEFYERLFLDIKYDGTNYILSNVKENHQSLKYLYDTDPSKYCYCEYDNSDFNSFLIVPKALIGY